MKVTNNLLLTTSIILLSCFCSQANAMRRGGEQPDPLISMAYSKAFDQKKIHEDFSDLMERQKCSQNVFDHYVSGPEMYIAPMPEEAAPSLAILDRQKAYEQACLKRLHTERTWAIAEPIKTNVITGGLLTASCLLIPCFSKDPTATGFGSGVAVFNTIMQCDDSIKACWHLKNPPYGELDRLEEKFAKNMCFIPKKLWRRIIEEFMSARTNQFSQSKHLEFLEFILDLTVYKPRIQFKTQHSMSFTDAIEQLFARIDHFFGDDYQATAHLPTIKSNLFNFLSAIKGDTQETNTPCYLYLEGSYGIGKTHFINALCSWIDELFPGSIKLSILQNIQSPAELEGSHEHPGALLRVLRDQLKEDRRGSVVFMDEATWLNCDPMVSVAKKVFNGNQSRLATEYFGDDIQINMPPMLIIVAANEHIKDQALASRFATIEFPRPTREALTRYAYQKALTSEYLRMRGVTVKGVKHGTLSMSSTGKDIK